MDGRVIDETLEAATDYLKLQDVAQKPGPDCASSIRDPAFAGHYSAWIGCFRRTASELAGRGVERGAPSFRPALQEQREREPLR